MRISRRQLPTALACLAAAATISSAADQSITEFRAEENRKLDWRIVDDGVITHLHLEEPGKFGETSAQTLLGEL